MFQRLQTIELLGRANVIWQALAWPGFEHVCVEAWSGAGGYTIDGLLVAVLGNEPSRVWYRIEVDDDWTFRSLNLRHTVEFSDDDDGPLDTEGQRLELVRTRDGIWDHDSDGAPADLTSCVDIDISVTPFTNSLPIRRLKLDIGATAEIDVVYVSVPQLALALAPQRYTRLDTSTYRFESLDSDFVADISVDQHSLVNDYPGLFRRVWSG